MFRIPFTAGALKASLWANAGLFVLLLGTIALMEFRVQAADLATAAEKVRATTAEKVLAERNREIAEQREAHTRAALETERKHREAFDQAAATYRKELNDAKATAARTVRDLRAGNLELRDHWQGCLSRERDLPGDTQGGSGADAAVRDREEGAGALVQAADECDARGTALQRVLLQVTNER